ncbi:MAG: hypothetical protein PVF54_05300 [Anaerolineae bacterium]|jgi:hypothetical protein
MVSYRIQLREIRLATDGTDDVALFDVTREEDGETWIVPTFLSPLFRVVQMRANAAGDSRRDMVAGLGARAILERLGHGIEPPLGDRIVFAVDYPGAPGAPDPLSRYEQATVDVEEVSSSGDSNRSSKEKEQSV